MTADVDFIIGAAPRLAKLSAMVAVSFGLGEGANRALKSAAENESRDDDWYQAVLGYQDGTLMMAVVRVALLLDADDRAVSFQSVYHRLKRPDVQDALVDRVYGDDADTFGSVFENSPSTIIGRFLSHYASIDWKIHGRLTHFRNLGVAHLSETPLTQSITYDELKSLVALVANLADELVDLCRVSFAPVQHMPEEWSDRGFSILKFPR